MVSPRKKIDPDNPEETLIDPPKETPSGPRGKRGRGLDDDFSQAEIKRKLSIGLNGLSRLLDSGESHAEKDFSEAAEALEDLVNHVPFPGKPIIRVAFSALAILDVIGKFFSTWQNRGRFRDLGKKAETGGEPTMTEVPSQNGGFHSPFGGFGR